MGIKLGIKMDNYIGSMVRLLSGQMEINFGIKTDSFIEPMVQLLNMLMELNIGLLKGKDA